MPSSSNLITKTGSVVLGTGLLAAAISQELYVVNEETVVAVGFVIIFSYLAKVGWFDRGVSQLAKRLEKTLRGPYRDWAQGHIDVSASYNLHFNSPYWSYPENPRCS